MGCPSGKKPLATEALAIEDVERHKAEEGFTMVLPWERPNWSHYRCPLCGLWHLTSGYRVPEGVVGNAVGCCELRFLDCIQWVDFDGILSALVIDA